MLADVTPDFWILLGEAHSKVEHLSGAPLTPKVAEHLNKIFLATGAAATTAIEGNTLSEAEVLRRIEGQLHLPASQEYLGQEIDNIVDACNQIKDRVVSFRTSQATSPTILKRYNKLVRRRLRERPDISPPGEVRTESVLVGNVYRGAPAEDCEFLLEQLCDWISGPDFQPPSEVYQVPFAIIKAIVAHLYIAWIHPFGDGNGRTARLLEFQLLLEAGLPVPAAHLLSDHYNRTRSEYYRQLDQASRSGGDVKPFIKYAVQGLVDGLRSQIMVVRQQQMQVSWEHFVHERFRALRASETSKRQRDLVLELGRMEGFVPVSGISELSVRLAKLYAAKGDRTVQRDINAADKLGLVERAHGEVRARKELISAFLPPRCADSNL